MIAPRREQIAYKRGYLMSNFKCGRTPQRGIKGASGRGRGQDLGNRRGEEEGLSTELS